MEEKYAKYGVSHGGDESRIWKYRGKRPGMDDRIYLISHCEAPVESVVVEMVMCTWSLSEAAETWRGESIGERKIGFSLPSVRDHRRWFVTESARRDDIERAAWKLSSGADRGHCYDPEKWASSLVAVVVVEGWNSIDFIDQTKISINSMILRIGKLFVSFLGLNASTISLNIVCFE